MKNHSLTGSYSRQLAAIFPNPILMTSNWREKNAQSGFYHQGVAISPKFPATTTIHNFYSGKPLKLP